MKKIWISAFALFLLTPGAHAVIGGSDAPEFKRHTVMVLSKKGSICSGALIARRAILTAAHCVTDGSDYAVHFRDVTGQPILLQPKKIIIHPNYVPDAIAKRVRSIDFAIVLINDALPQEFVPVGLSQAKPRAGEAVVIGGYGLTNESDRNSSGKFKSTALSVIEPYGPSQILLWLKGDRIESGPLNRGGCHGDSGGPLFYNDELVAITTWTTGPKGRDCGEMTQGALIAPQRNWIENAIR